MTLIKTAVTTIGLNHKSTKVTQVFTLFFTDSVTIPIFRQGLGNATFDIPDIQYEMVTRGYCIEILKI